MKRSRAGKQGRDDSIKQFSMQPHVSFHYTRFMEKDDCREVVVCYL